MVVLPVSSETMIAAEREFLLTLDRAECHFQETLSPSDPNACPYTINASVSENLMSGTYATFDCTCTVSGSISLTKQ